MDAAQLVGLIIGVIIAVTSLVAAMTACFVQMQALLAEVRAVRADFNGRLTAFLGVAHAAGVAEGKTAVLSPPTAAVPGETTTLPQA
jgi:hypothetical protein